MNKMTVKKLNARNLTERPFSRRTLLKGLGIGTAGLAVNLSAAQAQVAVPSEGLLGLERTTIGDVEITAIKDFAPQLPSDAFGGNSPEGAISELLGQYNLPTDSVLASSNVLLLRSGDELTLVDTGSGTGVEAANSGSSGSLMRSLAVLGVAPTDINHVVVTHWHGDHVNGVSAADGTLNFPNAAHHFPRLDWDYLQAQAANGEDIQSALDRMQPAEDAGLLMLYEGDVELVPGLTAIAAHGHTPGHHALMLGSGEDRLLIMGDTANHSVIALSHPEWSFGSDLDAAQATETRRRICGRAADEGLRVAAYHWAFPGFGYITRDGEGFRFAVSS